MDILDKARKLESTLARTLDRAAHQWVGSARREPLEVVHAIVEAVGERLEPAGRGTHVFPFNKLTLSVLAGSREAKARFAAVFEAEPTLQERITKRLHDAGCAPADLRVHARYVSRREAQWSSPDFHIEFARVQQAEEGKLALAQLVAGHFVDFGIVLFEPLFCAMRRVPARPRAPDTFVS